MQLSKKVMIEKTDNATIVPEYFHNTISVFFVEINGHFVAVPPLTQRKHPPFLNPRSGPELSPFLIKLCNVRDLLAN